MQVALWGAFLTYNPKTRPKGRRLLVAASEQMPEAVEALRQSLVWDAQNPANAAEIFATYLAKHNDAQLSAGAAERCRRTQWLRVVTLPLTQTPEQRAAPQRTRRARAEDDAAYVALNAQASCLTLKRASRPFSSRAPTTPTLLPAWATFACSRPTSAARSAFSTQAKQDGSKDPGLERRARRPRAFTTR